MKKTTVHTARTIDAAKASNSLTGVQYPTLTTSNLNYTDVRKGVLKRLVVDDYNKVIYCPVPKVASTNWLRTLLDIQHCRDHSLDLPALMKNGIHEHWTIKMAGMKYLNEYKKEEVMFRLKTYYKFMFIRHPLERLVSAYKDKFTKPVNKWSKHFHVTMGIPIIKRYRKDPSVYSLSLGDDVKFNEFVRYVIDNANEHKILNPHWRPMIELCDPYHIPYDFTGSFDNFDKDVTTVLDNLHDSTCKVNFPSAGSSGSGGVSRNITGYLNLLTPQHICRLLAIYNVDFQHFSFHRDVVC